MEICSEVLTRAGAGRSRTERSDLGRSDIGRAGEGAGSIFAQISSTACNLVSSAMLSNSERRQT